MATMDHSKLGKTIFEATPIDSYPTATSQEQRHTEDVLSNHRPNPNALPPPLRRNDHLQFLLRNMIQGFPARFVGQDASQTWLVYWTVYSFYVLGAGLDVQHKQRPVQFNLRPH